MPNWEAIPADYRADLVAVIESATRAGDCVSVVGLSGAGKSNLLGFLAQRASSGHPKMVLVDGNRLAESSPAGFLRLMRRALERAWPVPGTIGGEGDDALEALELAITRRLAEAAGSAGVCFLLDMSLLLDRTGRIFGAADRTFFSNLRALRDAHKLRLTYVAATRHRLPAGTELAELFYGHTVWLGPLAEQDARWTVSRYASRHGQSWDAATTTALMAAAGRYPALLRAVCEAHAGGVPAEPSALAAHPAVRARVEELWSDQPSPAELQAAGLADNALLRTGQALQIDSASLTAKEHRLLEFLQAHAGQVCAKDDLIRAVWPEDRVQGPGVRDDSLAQLVRRLREKVESNPAQPRHIHTVPGRGYRFGARVT